MYILAFKTTTSQEDVSWKKHLELAITWNRVDSAETKIFTEEKIWKVNLFQSTVYYKILLNFLKKCVTQSVAHKNIHRLTLGGARALALFPLDNKVPFCHILFTVFIFSFYFWI